MRVKSQIAAAAAALVAVLTLAACGSGGVGEEPAPTPEPNESSSATPTPGAEKPDENTSDNLDGIKVSKGKEPKIDFEAPFAIDETRTKVLKEGKGSKLSESSTAVVHYKGVNGRTGKPFDESYSRGEPVSFPLDQVVPGFKKGLTDQKVGSRVLIAMPGADGYDSSGGNPQAGIEVGDTLVFVVDITDGTRDRASGKAKDAPKGLPKVSGPGDAEPKVEIPEGAPPKKLESATLISGDGKKVAEGDTVTANFVMYTWEGGEMVETTYPPKQPATGPLGNLIAGWQEGLVGQKVGSRVLLVIPPDKAYPQGNNVPSIEPQQTLVYVVDILWTEQTQQQMPGG